MKWLMDEVSTRNCTRCMVGTDGVMVRCALGHLLLDAGGRPFTYEDVIESDELLRPCEYCLDFEKHYSLRGNNGLS